jgi:hypothetical protein
MIISVSFCVALNLYITLLSVLAPVWLLNCATNDHQCELLCGLTRLDAAMDMLCRNLWQILLR